MRVYNEDGVSGEDVLIWEKGQNLEQMKTRTSAWTVCGPTDKIEKNTFAVRAPQFTFSVPWAVPLTSNC